MATLTDKFLPTEWLNTIFVDIVNCDIITRPSQEWFLHSLYYLRKRNGLFTQIEWEVWQWELDGEIGGAGYFNNVIYPYSKNGSIYNFDGSELTQEKTGLHYDGVDYSYRTLDIAAYGGGRYPDEYTYYTVSSYDNINAEITINETLTTTQQAEIVGKYVYVKTGPAQWGSRAVESVPANNRIKLASWYSVDPTTGNLLYIYNKQITQTLFPQLRQWDTDGYTFTVTGVTTAPVAGDVYTNNSFEYTVVSVDISWGNWTIVTTGTGDPELAGTLTRDSWSGDASITFADSDIGIERLLSRDTEWNYNFLYFPNDRRIVKWDNRVFGLHKNRNTILPHNSQDPELVDTSLIVPLGSANAQNVDVFSGYLIVFFEDKIGLFKKVDLWGWSFVYQYQDILSFWLFSENSYIIYWGNFYVFANDRRFYSISISSTSGGDILAVAEDQGQIMVNYFSQISGGDVRFTYSFGVLRLIHVTDEWTNVYKFTETYKSWLRDTYSQGWNLFQFLYNIDNVEYTCFDNSLYSLSWLLDVDENIDQRIRMVWPLQTFNDQFMIVKTKIRLWFGGENQLWGRLVMKIGWNEVTTVESDIAKLWIIDQINQAVWWAWTMGSGVMGDLLMWGEPWIWEIDEYISEYIDIFQNIGKSWTYFDYEIINDTEKQLFFGWAQIIYQTESPNVVYNKNVI